MIVFLLVDRYVKYGHIRFISSSPSLPRLDHVIAMDSSLSQSTVSTVRPEIHVESSAHSERIASRTLPPKCHEVMNATNINNKRFVFGWLYFEQLTMATNNLFSLVWFARWWRARVVMPLTINSRMVGLPWSIHQQSHPLELLYDQYFLDELTCKYNLPPMTDFQEFLNSASRHLVMIHFMYDKNDLTHFSKIGGTRRGLIKALHNHYIIDCCNITYIKKIVATFKYHLMQNSNNSPFFVKRCLCVNAKQNTEPVVLLEKVGLHRTDNFSVIFTDWRGISNSPPRKNFRMFVPSSKDTLWPHPSHVVFPISTHVRGNATELLSKVASGEKFVAIHFRSEKIGQIETRKKNFTETCFAKALQLRDKLTFNYEAKLRTLYFTDYGSFGSSTCHNVCTGAKILGSLFSLHKLEVTHFSPSSFNAVEDSGFVALVEQQAIASAHALILVGGGSFQTQLHRRFRKYNPRGNVYRVCSSDSGSVELMKF